MKFVKISNVSLISILNGITDVNFMVGVQVLGEIFKVLDICTYSSFYLSHIVVSKGDNRTTTRHKKTDIWHIHHGWAGVFQGTMGTIDPLF